MIEMNFWQTVGLFFVLSMLIYAGNTVLVELREIRKLLQQIRHHLTDRPTIY